MEKFQWKVRKKITEIYKVKKVKPYVSRTEREILKKLRAEKSIKMPPAHKEKPPSHNEHQGLPEED